MSFFIGAALLCLLAMLFVLAPWFLHRGQGVANRRDAIIAIAKARLLELDNELAAGSLNEVDYRQLKLEQERRLLQEADVAALPNDTRRGRVLLTVFASLLPLLAAAAYFHFGGWSDWRIQTLMKQSESEMQAGVEARPTLDKLRKALQQRLDQRDDDDGRRRFMLARLDTEFGRYSEAVAQYAVLLKKFPEDASFTAQYAQALYLAANRQTTPEVLAVAQRALALDPNQSTALGLLGVAAFESGDFAQALLHWRHLLRMLPPDSANAAMIQGGIKQAEQALGSAGYPGPKVVVSVSLAHSVADALPNGGVLFVFAKAVNGPAMPLAVARLDPSSLPLEVTLDNSMAMAPGLDLSSTKQVQIFARITASGQVRGEPGDLEGSSATVDLTDSAQKLSLSIDRKL
ncbi:MAG: c-type cytochrome biosis protein CcmI [Verrucomicrobiaceae bacterium]|nr:c-type cytochrome biosis protein CcmI [Verrucomicrobiaceae bacterium]